MKTNPTKVGICLYDLQFPVHNMKLLAAWEQRLASRSWDFIIYGGDFMDMDAISHHAMESGNARALEGKRLKKDYEEASKILRRHRKIVGPKTKIYFLSGNHEEWAEQFVDRFPGLEGMVEIEHNLPFQELKIEVVKPRGYVKLGKIYFIHGDINSGKYTSAVHSRKIVDTYNRNVVYGHHHTLQAYTKVSPVGIDETHSAYCIPAMANIQPSWAKDKPNSWLNGYAEFAISDDRFTVIPVVAVNDGFIAPDYKEYSWKLLNS